MHRSGAFLANATCKVFFNVADLEVARFVSEIIGQATSLAKNQGSRSVVDMMREQHSMGLFRDQPLAAGPSEVLRLPGSRSLILYRSGILLLSGVLASKVNYRWWRHWRSWKEYDRWPALINDAGAIVICN
ncbi:TraM recognition domain-containing protein [Bradyrhizobium zhanjiangense]|uniref:TraM recognition domain-containing protein n=1 Tax=Bradyrhizobium zhanjiangense TaxID=1325107 RepID=UPI0024BFB09A|nr:TraM recognition domain-containing protein [Bradyrhizobium zhanjiangense]